ncbi:MAG: YggS family pyridoxal phosphate-dependent enzyme [Lachnospiraceae bacterium]|nr:YggS family pyridoxal phosphate-dependent enzyme [Lachnospiraceae bacterium]
MLAYNLEEVKNKISITAQNAGKSEKEITLIAVSKTKPVSMLQEVYDLGVRDFGENKVQEIMEKYALLPSDIRWHMIGHLQRNKVKYIIDKVSLIHSVDSLRLAEEIDKEAKKHQLIMPILIQVNIAEEESKFGLSSLEILEEIKKISRLSHIRVKGLMTVAPFVENGEDNRKYFKLIKQLSVDIMNENIDNVCMDIISMGMTGDYQTAIEEGSTMVRVGTAIFGERNYAK